MKLFILYKQQNRFHSSNQKHVTCQCLQLIFLSMNEKTCAWYYAHEDGLHHKAEKEQKSIMKKKKMEVP